MTLHRFEHPAMATTFEIYVPAEAHALEYARQATTAAFDELDRLERTLSRFISTSDIAQLNAAKPGEIVMVSAETMDCLRLARRVWEETGGVFDITVGHLQACYVTRKYEARTPTAEEVAVARGRTGMHLLEIDPEINRVMVRAAGMWLDLGAVGKGYAVDVIAALLQDWGITRTLIHGGQSSVLAVGDGPAEGGGWNVPIRHPQRHEEALATMCLRDCAVGASGVLLHGTHIVDPRAGAPAGKGHAGTWVVTAREQGAAAADALSTAFMMLTAEEIAAYCARHPEIGAMVADEAGVTRKFGAWEAFARGGRGTQVQ